jgi:hypothetical protein
MSYQVDGRLTIAALLAMCTMPGSSPIERMHASAASNVFSCSTVCSVVKTSDEAMCVNVPARRRCGQSASTRANAGISEARCPAGSCRNRSSGESRPASPRRAFRERAAAFSSSRSCSGRMTAGVRLCSRMRCSSPAQNPVRIRTGSRMPLSRSSAPSAEQVTPNQSARAVDSARATGTMPWP